MRSVKAHTRKTKSGKVVPVQQHFDKRDRKLSKEDVVQRLDQLGAVVRARMDEEVGLMMVALQPNEVYWMTPEEKAEMYELKRQLPTYGEEAAAARQRILERRGKRKAMTKSLPVDNHMLKSVLAMLDAEVSPVRGRRLVLRKSRK